MNVTTTEQWLLIILSAALAVFLILGITVLIYTVQIMQRLKRVAERAEDIADSVEETAEMFRKGSGPVSFIKVIAQIINAAKKNDKDRK